MDLLRAARSGDQEAFRVLVEPHLEILYRTALLIILDRELARDAVQEALVRAYRSMDRFRDENLKAWLHQSSGALCRNSVNCTGLYLYSATTRE